MPPHCIAKEVNSKPTIAAKGVSLPCSTLGRISIAGLRHVLFPIPAAPSELLEKSLSTRAFQLACLFEDAAGSSRTVKEPHVKAKVQLGLEARQYRDTLKELKRKAPEYIEASGHERIELAMVPEQWVKAYTWMLVGLQVWESRLFFWLQWQQRCRRQHRRECRAAINFRKILGPSGTPIPGSKKSQRPHIHAALNKFQHLGIITGLMRG